ncbi:hypothetical protein IKX64_01945 [Candidatus Saccharibacteria bacterium]|nr:hypothetical protein [Candidatus Saccharibacteria bacterium]
MEKLQNSSEQIDETRYREICHKMATTAIGEYAKNTEDLGELDQAVIDVMTEPLDLGPEPVPDTTPLERYIGIDSEEFPIFKEQAGLKHSSRERKWSTPTLPISETLGLMVGDTAKIVAKISGKSGEELAFDHVIYLDKSARPVSWMVDEFWEDFSTKERPQNDFLNIDRLRMFSMLGVEANGNGEIKDEMSGQMRKADDRDFIKRFESLPIEAQQEYLAKLRCLFIPNGIKEENPAEIMQTPNELEGKNVLIIDEVKNSGATMGIAKYLVEKATGAKNVDTFYFWNAGSYQVNGSDWQMGPAPVWYAKDPSDWRGRGVMDAQPEYYEKNYLENPNDNSRALAYGSGFLSVPLDFAKEPGQKSLELVREIRKMHAYYQRGQVLPAMSELLSVGLFTETSKMVREKLANDGVKFVRDGTENDTYVRLHELTTLPSD